MASNGTNAHDKLQPTSFTDLETLVLRFYGPSSPSEKAEIQDALTAFQRSPQGWQFADALLQSQHEQARFFGALTFTIKINLDWDTLDDANAGLVLGKLIQWLIQLVNSGDSRMVIRKLCSSLVAYYLRPSSRWKLCVRHLALCLKQGSVVSTESVYEQTPTSSVVLKLGKSQLLPILWFGQNLVEEMEKATVETMQLNNYYERISSNIEDIVAFLDWSKIIPPSQDLEVAEERLKCFQSWVAYAHRAWISKAMELQSLRTLTPVFLSEIGNEEMRDAVMELFTEILNQYSTFLTDEDFFSLSIALTTPESHELISKLSMGEFDGEPSSFAMLLLAYGEAWVEALIMKPQDPYLSQIVHQLVQLMSCQGYAGVEDDICSLALEFWTIYADFLMDNLPDPNGKEKPQWLTTAEQRVQAVIEACWIKIQLPSHEVAITWDADSKQQFKSFRTDFEDFLLSAYTFLGNNLFRSFAQLAVETLTNRSWTALEATIMCINALSDPISEENSADDILAMLFGSSLFEDMSDTKDQVPATTRQTAVNAISRYTGFFERHVQHLPAMLNFLFSTLKDAGVAIAAAKAILAACSTCRKVLIPELAAFIHQYEILLEVDTIDLYIKEKVLGGIAAIIQALPSDQDKLLPLTTLVQFVETDFDHYIEFRAQMPEAESQVKGVSALKCLVSMAKALQAPDEAVIDLNEDIPPSTFWTEGPGSRLQARIVRVLEKASISMRRNSDAIEAICQILRAGYKETTPSLYSFPPEVTVRIFLLTQLDTARLDYVLDTAGLLLAKHQLHSRISMDNVASSILGHVYQLVRAMDFNPATDPEVSASCVDLTDKMIPRYFDSLRNLPDIVGFISFTVNCLARPEIMTKRAAAHFWGSLMQKYDDVSPETIEFTDAIMQRYGPYLGEYLVHGIAGHAARSELDVLAEPLKRMITTQTRARNWLTAALESPSFPSVKVGLHDKRTWLQKMLNLRGNKGSNQAVKEFWIACKGAEFAYAS